MEGQSYSYTCHNWSFGTVREELENHFKTTRIPIVVSCLQKAALLSTAFILRGGFLAFQRVVNSQMSRLITIIIIIIIIIIKITTTIIIIIIAILLHQEM